MRERAEALALLEPLTDLPNRRAMIDWLTVETERGSATGLVLVGLDGFKDVNTAHGYPAGDAVLRETAARLIGAVRQGDVVARLGGDEFAVLAPDASSDVMRALADSVLAALRDLNHEGVRVTADFCLRGAKLTGKDRALSSRDWAPDGDEELAA